MSNEDFWKSVSAIIENDFPEEGLKTLSYYGEEIKETRIRYERFSPQEQRGLLRGGKTHAIASIIAGGSNRPNQKGPRAIPREEEKALVGQQEHAIEAWARKTGCWMEDVQGQLRNAYGQEIGRGWEAQVFYDGPNVVKSIGLDFFIQPQLALDRITLHNALFPETSLTVLGFGREKDGTFKIICQQPLVQAASLDEDRIEKFASQMGFRFDRASSRTFSTEDIYLSDLHDENVLIDDDGHVFVIDCDIRLNTPDLGLGGRRQLTNYVDVSMCGLEQKIQAAKQTDIPEKVIVHTTLHKIHKDLEKEHLAAKRGDKDSAKKIVQTVAKVSRLEQRLPVDAVFMPVKGIEGGSKNAIPTALALWESREVHRDYCEDVRQTRKAGHTGVSKAERFRKRVDFEGFVEYGKPYVLVDDHITMGGTLMAMTRYIRERGGIVAGITTLSASPGGSNFKILPSTLEKLQTMDEEGRLESLLKQQLGLPRGFKDLTNSEGRYLSVPDNQKLVITQLLEDSKQNTQCLSNAEMKELTDKDIQGLFALANNMSLRHIGCIVLLKVGDSYFALGENANKLAARDLVEAQECTFGLWSFVHQQQAKKLLDDCKNLGMRIGIADAPSQYAGQQWNLLDKLNNSLNFYRGWHL